MSKVSHSFPPSNRLRKRKYIRSKYVEKSNTFFWEKAEKCVIKNY